ncbi:MAG: phospholipid carrier-dependent glycosyltransferase [Candidatus Pacebacteria bacterium]|nr:phospholipid carrier-dependent glycosyltransferase [Candidatus Paceibacterota bacterium]
MKKLTELLKTETVWLILLFGLAATVRFRGLNQLAFFTYDQARDAFYIKRILDGEFRLIGTQSSIPGLYTGPLYYYLMAPFLFLFRLNPVGLDYATAFISLLTLFLLFGLLKKTTKSSFLAIIFTALYAFSPQIVNQSRFAWNPNPLPFLTLLFLFSLKKIIFQGEKIFLLILALTIGAAINLHYSGLALIFILLPIGFFFAKSLKETFDLKMVVIFLVFLGLFFLPLFLFDCRHGFINARSLISYLRQGPAPEISPPPFWTGLWDKFVFLFGLAVPLTGFWLKFLTGVSLFSGLGFFVKSLKEKTFFSLVFLSLFSGVLFACFYQGSFFNFYLTFLYPLPFLWLASFFGQKPERNRSWFFLGLVVVIILGRNFKSLSRPFRPARTIKDLERVALFLSQKINPGENFNLAALYRGQNRFDHNAVDYRYFLEARYKIKVPGWDVLDYRNAQICYLISEVGQVEIGAVKFWETQLMGALKEENHWDLGEDYLVYRLVKDKME